ncbi:MAG TPA: hypothetical protein VMY99_01345 [Nevskiaceae bacterium]|nr:hypothetical protein [Nevskiaceae bacterium]
MSKTAEPDLLKQLEEIRKQLRDRFAFVESADDLPKPWGGSGMLHIDVNPKVAFHFLEFIFDVAYTDIMIEAGFRFIDDKTTWEYFVMSENGFLRIYDWKGYTVSVGSFGLKDKGTEAALEKDAKYLKKLVEENLGKFDDYRQIQYKNHLDQYPFDNFMDAFVSLTLLFRDAMDELDNTHDYLEALILLVALLDTQLRYSILLTRINIRKSKKIDPDFWELFQQSEGGKFITERGIYKLAEDEVEFPDYDKTLFFKRINELYDIRNRAVHRFAITNFQYSESRIAVEAYRDLVDVLFTIIKNLEHEQVKLGVGFIKKGELDLPEHEFRKEIIRAVGGKIDSKALIPRTKEREPMFSDAYPDGYHPSLKEFMEEMKKEFSKKRPKESK